MPPTAVPVPDGAAPDTPSVPRDDAPSLGQGVTLVTAAVVAITVALTERVRVEVDATWGLVALGALLVWTILRAVAATAGGEGGLPTTPTPASRWYTALALVPLARLVSLAMPLEGRSVPVRYALIALPVLAAAALAVRAAGYRWREVGLLPSRSWPGLPFDAAIAAAGVGLGYAQFRVSAPQPLTDALVVGPGLALLVALLVLAGFAEEFLFRGLIQRATGDLVGAPLAVVVGAALGAALQLEHAPPLAVALSFAVALVFGAAFAMTGSLLGVGLGRGAANVGLLLLFPLRT